MLNANSTEALLHNSICKQNIIKSESNLLLFSQKKTYLKMNYILL